MYCRFWASRIEWSMAAMGHSRPVQPVPLLILMSALTPESDLIVARSRNVAMGQIRTHAPQQGTSYSITWSARTSSVGGTARPSAFAVFRLTSNSNLVACSIGKSAGLVPWRILSTNTAARRNVAKTFTRSRSDRQPVQAPCFRAKECAAFLPAPRSPQHWH